MYIVRDVHDTHNTIANLINVIQVCVNTCKLLWNLYIKVLRVKVIYHRYNDYNSISIIGFTTTYAISPITTEFKSRSGAGVQHYVIKFVSDLRQVGGFLRVHRFPPPIKLTAMI